MATKYTFYDGQKAYSVLDDTPGLWTYFSNAPRQDIDILYAKVSAVFRAFNLKANTVGGTPFVLTNLKTGEEFDNSASWENKIKIMPNPSELFRLNTLSYMNSNAVYNLLTRNIVGRDKVLRNAIPSAFTPQTDPITANLSWVERRVGSGIEKYDPDGNLIDGNGRTDARLIRMWRLDHTTEVLPSPNTEALAITNAAGVIYHADTWIRHFFERGGVVPMVIAMKGMVPKDTREEEEKSWSKWYLGLRDRFSRIFRVTNAEALDVKQVGSGIEQLKDNITYQQSLANIAMGTGMPLSLLLANSANYATAKEEKATWYENDIIPLCSWMAYHYNEQVFHPLNLHLEFHPETLDPQQEDETERAVAFSTYGDTFGKYPTYGLWRGMADTLGLEISDGLDKAAQAYYADKEQKEKEMQERMQQGGQTIGPDGKPVPEQKPDEEKPSENPETETEQPEPDDEDEDKAKSAFKANENSAMIALRIPEPIREEIRGKYPFVDAETLSELHITLIYLGDSRTLNKIDMIRAASDFAQYQAPIKGTLQGLARFVSEGDLDPLVVTFDSPQMPKVYTGLASCLETYHIPYHREHGFIPHMTLAYIPAADEIPIDTIEPIEINFSEIYLVDGGQWFSVSLTGYDNTRATWAPTLDQLEEIRVYREVALRKQKKSEPLDFDYEIHNAELPAEFMAQVRAKLAIAQSAEDVKAAFVIEDIPVVRTQRKTEPLTIDPDPAIAALAESLNKLADATMQGQQGKAVDTPAAIPASPVQLFIGDKEIKQMGNNDEMLELFRQFLSTFSLPAPVVNVTPNIVVPDQPAPIVNVTNEIQPAPVQVDVRPAQVEVKPEIVVKPAPVQVVQEKGKRKATVKRDLHGRITEITADDEP